MQCQWNVANGMRGVYAHNTALGPRQGNQWRQLEKLSRGIVDRPQQDKRYLVTFAL